MKFLTIDFESANRFEYSPCSVSIFEFNNNTETLLYNTLINPGPHILFEDFCVDIHGISEKMVQNAPNIEDVLLKITDIIANNFIFAHNAYYDISKIIEGCNVYNINIPYFEYADSLIISKRAWEGLPNYRLDTVAEYLNISFNHHNSEDDAKVCGNILLKAIEKFNVTSIDELLSVSQYSKGFYKNNEWIHAYSKYRKSKQIHTDYQKVNSLTIATSKITEISGKYIVFTGALAISRVKAMELCANNGAIPQAGITKKTNYLIVGKDDYGRFKLGNKSNKMIKAEELIKEGQDLEIITEEDFFMMI
jgi:DNA polymerase-3 subunit epsilon